MSSLSLHRTAPSTNSFRSSCQAKHDLVFSGLLNQTRKMRWQMQMISQRRWLICRRLISRQRAWKMTRSHRSSISSLIQIMSHQRKEMKNLKDRRVATRKARRGRSSLTLKKPKRYRLKNRWKSSNLRCLTRSTALWAQDCRMRIPLMSLERLWNVPSLRRIRNPTKSLHTINLSSRSMKTMVCASRCTSRGLL